MQITVHFLGPARDWAGREAGEVEFPEPCTIGQLRTRLAGAYPGLAKSLPFMRVAVNRCFQSDDRVLEENDEVALIPPVSGG